MPEQILVDYLLSLLDPINHKDLKLFYFYSGVKKQKARVRDELKRAYTSSKATKGKSKYLMSVILVQ